MEQSARRSAWRVAVNFFIVTASLTLLYHLRESIVIGAWNPGTLDPGDLNTIPWHEVMAAMRGGLLFASATACLLFYLLGRELSARERAEQQRSEALAEMERLAIAAGRQARALDAIFQSIADAVTVYDMAGLLVGANPAALKLLGIEALDANQAGLGQPRFRRPGSGETVAGADLPVTRALGGETVLGERLTCLAGASEPRVMVVTAAPLMENGVPYGAVQVLHDVTEREQLLAELEQRVCERTRDLMEANRLLEERVAERTREFATLLDISRNLTSSLQLRPLLDEILDQLRVLVPYDAGAVLAQQENRLVMLSYRGSLPAEQIYALRFGPAGMQVYQAIGEAGGPLIVGEVEVGGLVAQALAETGSDLLAAGRAWLGVPVVIKGRLIAVLCLLHAQPHYFTEHHGRLAQAIANQAAMVIENARLYLEGLRAAALEERQRLARELHDSISQNLYGVVLGANSARELVLQQPRQAAEVLDDLLGLAEGSLAEMRGLIFELRPESLESDGLVPALGRLASALQARHQVPVFTDLAEEPPLSSEDKQNMYRIAQEALHNVAKHARARRAGLRLYRDDGTIVLEVSDDGAGFDPSHAYPGHIGLQSMRERAESIGGSLNILSAKGQGTVVRAQISAPYIIGRNQVENTEVFNAEITRTEDHGSSGYKTASPQAL